MLGSPGRTRRRRLIDGVVGTISGGNNADNNYYTAVPSSSSRSMSMSMRMPSTSRRQRRSNNTNNSNTNTITGGSGDMRKQRHARANNANSNIPIGFRQVDSTMADHDHRYRIAVAKDGSMITAVPIRKEEQHHLQQFDSPTYQSRNNIDDDPRSSPILYSDARAFSTHTTFLKSDNTNNTNAIPHINNINRDSSPSTQSTSTIWSKQGLLDARGKQRHKMKLMRPSSGAKKGGNGGGGGGAILPDVRYTARDQLKRAKGLLHFTTGGIGGGVTATKNHHNSNNKNNRNNINTHYEESRDRMKKHGKNNTAPANDVSPPLSHPSSSNDPTYNSSRQPTIRWDLDQTSSSTALASATTAAAAAVATTFPQSMKHAKHNNDDESISSFPILGAFSAFDEFNREDDDKNNDAQEEDDEGGNDIDEKEEQKGSQQQQSMIAPNLPVESSPSTKTTIIHANDATLKQIQQSPQQSPQSQPNNATATTTTSTTKTSFETLLQQRIIEIQSQQMTLAQSISKKQSIERTLITAIDQNLEKNRKEWLALEEELKVIQWHLDLNAEKADHDDDNMQQQHHQQRQHLQQPQYQQQQQQQQALLLNNRSGSVQTPSPERDQESALLIQNNNSGMKDPSPAYDMDSIGDPSLTMMDSLTFDDSTVAAMMPKFKTKNSSGGSTKGGGGGKRHPGGGAVKVTGLDPPARPSPPHTKEILDHRHPLYLRERKEPDGPRISAVLRGDEHLGFIRGGVGAAVSSAAGGTNVGSNMENRVPLDATGNHKFGPSRMKHPRVKPLPIRPLNSSTLRPPLSFRGQQRLKKFVHFNLPSDNESAELKFDSNNSNSSPAEFVNRPITRPLPRVASKDGDEDISSWQGEHYDVDVYDEDTGDLITNEHYDTYQWRDKEHHVLTTEHYSRENHHNSYPRISNDGTVNQNQMSFQNFSNHNGNRGVSSDSVETNPDLGFMYSVAAVVIQTAVRRFLAEIAAVERIYAVQVIQTAICNWMARKRNPYYGAVAPHSAHGYYEPFRVHDTRPQQQTKHVMFEDDYSQIYYFAATEIQRCFRGWWVRDGLEVDHFAATTIQSIFRGWWTRESLETDAYCATQIQRIMRGYLGRMSYIYDLYSIILVQSVARRYMAFYTSAVRLANIIYIQAIYRGYTVRLELMRYVLNGQEVAATVIQAQWRSYDGQMNYVNTLADILIVQSVARRWLTLKKMKARKNKKSRQKIQYKNPQPSNSYSHSNSSMPGWKQEWQQRRMKVKKSKPMNNIEFHKDQDNYSTPPNWQQHKTNETRSEDSFTNRRQPIEGLGIFSEDSVDGEGWYDGNKSETSDMLRSWKGRSSK